jgi:hypothetical protein
LSWFLFCVNKRTLLKTMDMCRNVFVCLLQKFKTYPSSLTVLTSENSWLRFEKNSSRKKNTILVTYLNFFPTVSITFMIFFSEIVFFFFQKHSVFTLKAETFKYPPCRQQYRKQAKLCLPHKITPLVVFLDSIHCTASHWRLEFSRNII